MFDSVSDGGLVDAMSAAARAESAAIARRLSAVGELYARRSREWAGRELWCADPFEAVAAEVSAAQNISRGRAGTQIRYALELRDHARDALLHGLAQVQRLQRDVGTPDRMVESVVEVRRERILAGVTAGTVAAVVADRHRLDEGHVEAQGRGDRPGDLRHLERTDPDVRAAARRYDERRAKLTARPLTDEARLRSAMWWLARGLRALAGIEPIRTERRN